LGWFFARWGSDRSILFSRSRPSDVEPDGLGPF
jgi:hypothetical protein